MINRDTIMGLVVIIWILGHYIAKGYSSWLRFKCEHKAMIITKKESGSTVYDCPSCNYYHKIKNKKKAIE